jgi:hypothetical protein
MGINYHFKTSGPALTRRGFSGKKQQQMKTEYSHDFEGKKVYTLYVNYADKLTNAQIKKQLIAHLQNEIGSSTITAMWLYQRPHILAILPNEQRLYIVHSGQTSNEPITAPTINLYAEEGKTPTLQITTQPERYLKKLTEHIEVPSNFSVDVPVIPVHEIEKIVSLIVNRMAAYEAAYHAVNNASNDLQKRMDIAKELKQYD